MKRELGIYLHIPFCKSKCYYCDFVSFTDQADKIEEYVQALKKEILANAEIIMQSTIKSIYFGGGTPSFIDSKFIKEILDTIFLFIESKENISVTIECNPCSLTEEKLKEYLAMGINRFSIGMQSTHDHVLKSIGRIHTFDSVLNLFPLFKKYHVLDVNLDLIYPLPGIDLTHFKETIDTVVSLSEKYPCLGHVSVYGLELHPNTKLDFLISNGYLTLAGELEEYQMKEYLEQQLEKYGFHRYEIANYAKDGRQSIHNVHYWNQGEYLGFGVHASSFYHYERYCNTSSLNDYLDFYLKDQFQVKIIEEKEELSFEESKKEYILLRLRMEEGVIFKQYESRFKTSCMEQFKPLIDGLVKKGLLTLDKKGFRLTKRGRDVANYVWQEFI